jgi:hypothetical protein
MASQRPKKQNPKDDKSMLVAIVFFVGAGALVAYSMLPDTASPVASKNALLHNEKYEAKVNRHLMLTNEKMEMQRQRMIMENEALAPEYFRTKATHIVNPEEEHGVLNAETHAVDVAKELDRDTKTASIPNTPDELIQAEVFNQQQEREYTRAYKEEYANQFIANAAKNGWKVKLNSEYKVISVAPIRNPSAEAPQLFKSGGGGAQ